MPIVDASEVLLKLGMSGTVTEEERALVGQALAEVEGSVRKYLRYDPCKAERTEFHPQQPFQAQISRGIWEVMEQRATLRQVAEAATNELQLQCLPVRGDPLVVVRRDYDGRSESRSGSFPDSSVLVIGQDFWPNYDILDVGGIKVCRDGILRTIGLWPTTSGTVKVTYTAGYSADEFRGKDPTVDGSPIWSAVIQETCRAVRRAVAMKKGLLGLPAGVKTSESLGSYSYSLDGQSTKELFEGDLMGSTKEKLSEYVNFGWSLGS